MIVRKRSIAVIGGFALLLVLAWLYGTVYDPEVYARARLLTDRVREGVSGTASPYSTGPSLQQHGASASSSAAASLVRALSPRTRELWHQVFALDAPSAPLELPHVRAGCGRMAQHWQEDVYIECTTIVGGFTTTLSEVRSCLRIAMDLGVNVVVPRIAERSQADISVMNDAGEAGFRPYDYWLEEDALRTRLRRACPQLKIAHRHADMQPDLDVRREVTLNMAELPHYDGLGPYAWAGSIWAKWWHLKLGMILAPLDVERGQMKAHGVDLVHMSAPLGFFRLDQDITRQEVAHWTELMSVQQYKRPARQIVDRLLRAFASYDGQNLLSLKPFVGVHFRAERDIPDSWHRADKDMELYVDLMEQAWRSGAFDTATDEKLAYIACGEQEQIDALRAKAAPFGWRLVDKWTLADEPLLAELNALHFDHLGIIDLGMLVPSRFYIGSTQSAFSFTVAHMRDPIGRYRGSTFDYSWDAHASIAKSHLIDFGEPLYQCCL